MKAVDYGKVRGYGCTIYLGRIGVGCFVGLISPETGVVICSKRIVVIEILDKTGHGTERCFLEVKGMRSRTRTWNGSRNRNRNMIFNKGNLY